MAEVTDVLSETDLDDLARLLLVGRRRRLERQEQEQQ